MGLLVGCDSAQIQPDHGSYATVRPSADYDIGPSHARGILVESLRLGERISFASSIDPDLNRSRGGGVLGDHRGLVPSMNILAAAQSAAAGKYDILGAFGVNAYNGQSAEKDEKSLAISILAFPSEDIARAAAAEMARADFEQGADNAPIIVPEYPGALAHWRPSVPTVGSWLTWKNLVIRVFAKVLEPRAELLAEVLTKTYRAQLADLEGFTPTSESDLPNLRADPDRLLTRVVQTAGAELNGDTGGSTFAVYGPRAFSLLAGRPSEFLADLRAASVSQMAVANNQFLRRHASAEAAKSEAARLPGTFDDDYVAMAGVASLPDVACWERKQPDKTIVVPSRFRCLVHRGMDLVILNGYLELDIRQRAAAQYALLAEDR
ncbi:hypothetical protein [Nocardia sp. NPDC058666]|uniref:DUF7373 family lipoprotein n=1 Tax=Nocardia sp. NPDC058666 TaxID=3346587 RepID=UPI003664281B